MSSAPQLPPIAAAELGRGRLAAICRRVDQGREEDELLWKALVQLEERLKTQMKKDRQALLKRIAELELAINEKA